MSVAALRSTVATAITVAAIPNVTVSSTRRRPGAERRTLKLVEIGIAGSAPDGRPDMAALEIRCTIGGAAVGASELALDNLLQAVEDALPAQVTAPDWVTRYDQDQSMWIATGTVVGFRE